MARFRNVDWDVHEAENNRKDAANCHEAALAVLMDIRDELQTLNAVFQCGRFLAIPDTLKAIQRNTAKKRKPRATR